MQDLVQSRRRNRIHRPLRVRRFRVMGGWINKNQTRRSRLKDRLGRKGEKNA
jgi:hypothetical protein